jgi:hypothetical protein
MPGLVSGIHAARPAPMNNIFRRGTAWMAVTNSRIKSGEAMTSNSVPPPLAGINSDEQGQFTQPEREKFLCDCEC